ncbi:MAG TPA: hypothetical protein VLF14_06835, partial [Candidatus Binatia bacterium]|nr:hypothetical protein [Candidatus Binatia bacterium]
MSRCEKPVHCSHELAFLHGELGQGGATLVTRRSGAPSFKLQSATGKENAEASARPDHLASLGHNTRSTLSVKWVNVENAKSGAVLADLFELCSSRGIAPAGRTCFEKGVILLALAEQTWCQVESLHSRL